MSSPSKLSTDCVQQEIDLLPYNEDRKESVWKSSVSFGCLLVAPGPIVTKNRHIEQSYTEKVMISKGSKPEPT